MIEEVYRPASPDEAVAVKEREGAVYLAGGTQVNWAPSGMNPAKAVLLAGLLPNDVTRRENGWEIGAGITLQDLVDAPEAPAVLRRAASMIPARCVRNMATLGGNIAANRTDSYLLPALIALGAEVETVERGVLSVEAYITGGEDALITRVRLPKTRGACVVDRVVRSSAALPTLTLGVRVAEGEAVIALGCVAPKVTRLREVEARVVSGALETETTVFRAVFDSIDPPAGLKESAAYRRYITATMVARAVTACRKQRG